MGYYQSANIRKTENGFTLSSYKRDYNKADDSEAFDRDYVFSTLDETLEQIKKEYA